MDANAILKLIAGSPLDLANAGAYFVQEGWATAQLVAGVLAQSVPTEVTFGMGGDAQSGNDAAWEAITLVREALGFMGSEDVTINKNREDFMPHDLDPVSSNTPFQQVSEQVVEMEGGGKRKKGGKSSRELQQQLTISQSFGRQEEGEGHQNDCAGEVAPKSKHGGSTIGKVYPLAHEQRSPGGSLAGYGGISVLSPEGSNRTDIALNRGKLVEFNRLRESSDERTAYSARAAIKKAHYLTRNSMTSEEMQLAFEKEIDSQQNRGNA